MTYTTTNTRSLNAYMRRHYKKETDPDKLAKAAYYVYRNREIVKNREIKELRQDVEPVNHSYNGVITLSQYYKKKKIPHEILLYVPRSISTIDDVIMENELALAIKVNTPNPFYLGKFTRYSNVGDMDEEMQGADAYAVDGLAYSGEWQLVSTRIPVVPHTENKTYTHTSINIDDPAAENQSVKVTKEIQGNSAHFSKVNLLDIYDYLEEERANYEMAPSFENYIGKTRKQLEAKKTEYLDRKEKRKLELLEAFTKSEYAFDVEEVKNYNVVKTGRHHEDPVLEYQFEFSTDGLISKAGANYLLDVGKLIEKQVELSEDELEREFNIYQNYPRTYSHAISINLPDTYKIQGIEKLNRAVENETGGFVSSATMENNELKLDILKYYANNYYPKEQWPEIVAFIREAHDFTHAKLLMKKN